MYFCRVILHTRVQVVYDTVHWSEEAKAFIDKWYDVKAKLPTINIAKTTKLS